MEGSPSGLVLGFMRQMQQQQEAHQQQVRPKSLQKRKAFAVPAADLCRHVWMGMQEPGKAVSSPGHGYPTGPAPAWSTALSLSASIS